MFRVAFILFSTMSPFFRRGSARRKRRLIKRGGEWHANATAHHLEPDIYHESSPFIFSIAGGHIVYGLHKYGPLKRYSLMMSSIASFQHSAAWQCTYLARTCLFLCSVHELRRA